MTSGNGDQDRRRGNIRERGNSLQVRVYAGTDPVTSKLRYLAETIKGTDRAAPRLAEKALTKLQAQVDKQRLPETSVRLAHALDEWLRVNEIERTTRGTHEGYIERTIKPAIGTVAIDSSVRGRWRRSIRSFGAAACGATASRWCDGKPFIERHKSGEEHDCVASE